MFLIMTAYIVSICLMVSYEVNKKHDKELEQKKIDRENWHVSDPANELN